MPQTKREKAIHASRVRATNKAKTLGTRIFRIKGGTVTVEAKTKRGLKGLKKAKSFKDFQGHISPIEQLS